MLSCQPMWTERYCKSGAGDCNDGDKGESWRMAASVRERKRSRRRREDSVRDRLAKDRL